MLDPSIGTAGQYAHGVADISRARLDLDKNASEALRTHWRDAIRPCIRQVDGLLIEDAGLRGDVVARCRWLPVERADWSTAARQQLDPITMLPDEMLAILPPRASVLFVAHPCSPANNAALLRPRRVDTGRRTAPGA